MAQHPGIMPQGVKRSYPFASPPGMRTAEDPEARRPPPYRPPVTGGLLQPPQTNLMGATVVTIEMFNAYQARVSESFDFHKAQITGLQDRVQAMEGQIRSLEEAEDMAIDAVREIRNHVVPRIDKHDETLEGLTGKLSRQNSIVEALGSLGQEFRAQGRNDPARPNQLSWRPGPLGNVANEQQTKSTLDELKAQVNSSFAAISAQEGRIALMAQSGDETHKRVAKLEQRSNHGLIPAHISAIMQHHQQRLQTLEEQLQQQAKIAQEKPAKSQRASSGGSKQSREPNSASKNHDQQKSPTEAYRATPEQMRQDSQKPQPVVMTVPPEFEQRLQRLEALDSHLQQQLKMIHENETLIEERLISLAPLEKRFAAVEEGVTGIKPMEQRLSSLHESIAAIKPMGQHLTSLQESVNRIQPLEQRITSLHEVVAGIKPMEQRITSLQERIDGFEPLEQRLASLQESIKNFRPLEQRLTLLEEGLGPFKQRLSSLEETNKDVKPLKQHLSSLEESLKDIKPLEQRATLLEESINPIKQNLTSLEKQWEGVQTLRQRLTSLEEDKKGMKLLEERLASFEEGISGIKPLEQQIEEKIVAVENRLGAAESSLENLSKMAEDAFEMDAVDAASAEGQYQILTNTDFQTPEDLAGLSNNEDTQLLMQLFGENDKCEDACYTVQRACVHMWSYLLCRSRKDPRLISDFWKTKEWEDYPTILELERSDDMPSGKYFPRYVYEVGEIFNRRVVTKYNGRQATHRSTGYHLVVDVTNPDKGLWIVYRYEDVSKDSRSLKSTISYKRDTFWHPFANVGEFDIAQVFERISDWRGADTPVGAYAVSKRLVRQTCALIRPTFVEPKLQEVKDEIRRGWSKNNSIEARPANGNDTPRAKRGRPPNIN